METFAKANQPWKRSDGVFITQLRWYERDNNEQSSDGTIDSSLSFGSSHLKIPGRALEINFCVENSDLVGGGTKGPLWR
jgi:hypothetical protein